jgi:xanthine/CO dehydrogenase XdhC/CoxF family maturation factor
MFVVFTDADYWAVQGCKKGFRHCYLMRSDHDTVWTIFNPCRSHLDVSYELVSDYPSPLDYALANDTVVKYNPKTTGFNQGITVMSCVGVVKYMLGINAPFVLTPYQLYRHLHD